MASIDTRPAHVKALSWLGIALVCSPLTIAALTAIEATAARGASKPTAADVLICALMMTAFLSPLVALAAQVANPRFDMRRPDFGEFLKGLVLGPAWLVCAVVAIALTAFFVAALIRFVFAVA